MNELEFAPAALPYIITKHGLPMLLEILGLNYSVSKIPTALDDAVIVAIDFEGIETIRSGFAQEENCQVGFAILDTKMLRQPGVPIANLISTSNFAAGTPSYVARASNRFLFGDTVAIRGPSIVHAVRSHIPQDRNLIIVGHGVIHELHALRYLGFEFERPPSGILDTHRVANEVLGFWAGSLGDLLTTLACPFNRLHVAGNDAHFTLRALLLLAAKWCINQGQEDHEPLDILLDISYSFIPLVVDLRHEAAIKRERRLARSVKNQSKSWSKEKQNSIRAARERRRLQKIEDEEGDYMLELLPEVDETSKN